MFLLVSGRHVSAHLGGHQHGVSIQIPINLGKTFLRISHIRKIAVTWILARVFAYLPSFYFQIIDLIYWTVLIFFGLFWMAWHWKPWENEPKAFLSFPIWIWGTKLKTTTIYKFSKKKFFQNLKRERDNYPQKCKFLKWVNEPLTVIGQLKAVNLGVEQ